MNAQEEKDLEIKCKTRLFRGENINRAKPLTETSFTLRSDVNAQPKDELLVLQN
jgi:hypothetical protein